MVRDNTIKQATTPLLPPRGRIFNNSLELIGGTPMVRIPRISREDGLKAEVLLKLEYFNPLSSVKDRIGLAMVEQAESEGIIRPGQTVLVEPTSGNTGIALAFVAAAKGYRLVVIMPEGASLERRKMLRLLGAELILTPAREGMSGAIRKAREMMAEMPDSWMPRQFDNAANPAIHEHTTAEEIWTDTDGRVDIVVGGSGTGGTMTGIARALKPRKPGIKMYVVEPAESAVISGDEPGPHAIQGIGPGFIPHNLDVKLMDHILRISERDALATARRLAKTEGIPVGISSGAALHAALEVARDHNNEGKVIVAIMPSFAERYFSTALFAGF
jgi:cysteine synthase A